MKITNAIKLIIILNLVSCIPGNQRDACRYNAQSKKDQCEFSKTLVLIACQASSTVSEDVLKINALYDCLKYENTIEDCKKGENKYIPSIYCILKIEKDHTIKNNPEKPNLVRRVES